MSHRDISLENKSWVHRFLLKDKIRCRERYCRPFTPTTTEYYLDNGPSVQLLLLPDALFLRKYLTFWEELISVVSKSYSDNENGKQQSELKDDQSYQKCNDINSLSIKLFLLESSAEAMDARNAHLGETASPNERDRIAKLYLKPHSQQESHHNHSTKNSRIVDVFPDLSYRCEEDEMDLFDYAHMKTLLRSQNALPRAGKMLMQHTNKHDTSPSKKNVVLLSADGVSDSDYHLSNMTIISSIPKLLHLLQQKFKCITNTEHDILYKVSETCESIFALRNSKSHDNTTNTEKVWSTGEIYKALKNKVIHKGIINIKKRYKGEASITISKKKYFFGNDKIRALPGDTVAVQILPKSEWQPAPLGTHTLIISSSLSSLNREDQEKHDCEININDYERRPPVPTAKIIHILEETGRREIVATFQQQQQNTTTSKAKNTFQGGGDMILVTPMDIRYPKVRISGRNHQEWANKRIVVRIDSWNMEDQYASGHFVRLIGPVGDLESEISSLLIENKLDMVPFSMNAKACLPLIPNESKWSIPAEEADKRKDLRMIPDLLIYSVDPPGCQDIDDTMHARVLMNGDIEVGVHIADVAHFIPQGCALDREAAAKATTFYLVDRRFDMLPSLLSSDLCSLHGGEDRLAVSVIWKFSKNWERKSVWMGRTIIHNCQAMTYEQAHNILHGTPPDSSQAKEIPPLTAGAPVSVKLIPSLLQSLKLLTSLARFRKASREKLGGAIDLTSASPELKFDLDVNGNPIRVMPKEDKEIHHTIAEMMIMANQYVAEQIHEVFPFASLLRIHKSVDKDTSELKQIMKKRGITLDDAKNSKNEQNLAISLQKMKDMEPSKQVTSYVQSIATRVLSEAQYVCTGTSQEEGWRHYGLGIDKYTHFTSPIRRYADVVVHRLLLASLLVNKKDSRIVVDSKFNNNSVDYRDSHQQITVPKSSTISVLKGEALGKYDDPECEMNDDFLDDLIEGASDLALNNDIDYGGQESPSNEDLPKAKSGVRNIEFDPYETEEITHICVNLNQQHRMAKIASMECQTLFLSLYFRNNMEITSAVVINLRSNGLLVYIPKYDIKSPIFLSDREGIHIDPILVGMDANDGLPPSDKFSVVKEYRKFPNGICLLEGVQNQDDEMASNAELKLIIPSAPKMCIFKPLDIITIQLSCDTSDSNARFPLPRVHVISPNKNPSSQGQGDVQQKRRATTVTSKLVHSKQNCVPNNDCSNKTTKSVVASLPVSIYQIIHSVEIGPKPDIQHKTQETKKKNQPTIEPFPIHTRQICLQFLR